MIPVLYDALEKSFIGNGIGHLKDAVSCIVTEERNGIYELELTYPAQGWLAEHIAEDCIIKAKANDEDDPQLFRIYKSGREIRKNVTWYAEHISYELSRNPVAMFKTASVNAQDAMQQLFDAAVIPHEFKAHSDITTANSTSFDEILSVRNILGGTEGSLLDVWGGEYHFDNYDIWLKKNRGSDNGVKIMYGKNLITAEQERNIANIATSVYPYAYYTPENQDGGAQDRIFVSLPEKVLVHENAKNYATIKCIPVDLSDQFTEGEIITENALRTKALERLNNGVIEPEITLRVTQQNLNKTKDYKNLAAMEKIKLCDIVTVDIDKLKINVKAKIVKVKYDSLKEKYKEMEIGSARTNLAKTIATAEKEQQESVVKITTRTEKIKAQIGKVIKDITAGITGNSGGYVVLHPEQNPQEIFIMDTPDTATAKNVWRWNLAGLGHSNNGIGGEFTTAITADGQIVADFITAGEFIGTILKAGTVYAEALDIGYRESVTKYAGQVAEEAQNEAEKYADTIKGDLQKEIGDVDKKADDIGEEIKTALKDGVITTAEKAVIDNAILQAEKEKAEADARYEELYKNTYLRGTSKSTLKAKYDAVFGTDTTSKYNTLIEKANEILKTETADEIEKAIAVYETAHDQFNTALAEYTKTIEQALDNITYNYAADAEAEAIKESTSKIKTAADQIEMEVRELDYSNRHDYIVNGNFADDLNGWSATPAGANTVDTFLGTKCVKIVRSDGYLPGLGLIMENIAEGKYILRLKAAAAIGSENARINCSFTQSKYTAAGELKTDKWTQIDLEFEQTTAGKKYLYVRNYTVGTTIYVTDIQLLGNFTKYSDSKLTVMADEISSKVSSADLSSEILQSADAIRLKADKIAWISTGSSMTEEGKLTCKNGQIGGWNIGTADMSISNTTKRLKLDNTGFEATAITKVGSNAYEQVAKQNAGSLRFAVNNTTTLILGALYGTSGNFSTGFNVYKNLTFVPNGGGSTAFRYGGGEGSGSYGAPFYFGTAVKMASLSVSGSKSREASTNDYGKRLLYCYEMPAPMFGDIGAGETDDSGICYIEIDEVFTQTVNANNKYYVFLQKEGKGDLWVEEKTNSFFVVKGTPNTKFAWEIKAMQKGFEDLRLDDSSVETLEDFGDNTPEIEINETVDYETQAVELLEEYLEEMEINTYV